MQRTTQAGISHNGTRKKPARQRRADLRLEALEERSLLAAGSISASLVDGILRINGTDGPDAITVRQMNNQISIARLSGSYAADAIQKIVVDGGNGNDTIRLDSETRAGRQPILLPTALFGGAGNDLIVGGAGHDVIVGGAGNDQLFGRGGNDVLDGRDGFTARDRLFGGDGDDRLIGERGLDLLDGGLGTNVQETTDAFPVNENTTHFLEWMYFGPQDRMLRVSNWQTFPHGGYPFYIKIDNEVMQVISDHYGTYWMVNRGQLGTTAAAHAYGATVTPYTQQTTRLAQPRAISPIGTITEAKPTFQWTASPGAAKYELFITVKGLRTALYHIRADTNSYNLGRFEATAALTNGQTYTWWVRAHNATEDASAASEWSAGVDVTYRAVNLSAPGLTGPTGTSATTTPTLTWNAVSGADRYDVWVNDNTSNISQVLRTEVRGTSWTVNRQLTPGNSYTFWVRALSGASNGSAWSTPLSFTVGGKPTAAIPVTLTAASSTQVNVAWTDIANESSYTVWYSRDNGATWTKDATLPANTVRHELKGLAPSTTYLVSVGSHNSFGDTFTDGRNVTTLAAPARPTAPAARALVRTATEVELTWNGVANASGYRVERWVNGAWQFVVTVGHSPGSSNYSHPVPGLPTGTTSYFRVGAINASNTNDIVFGAFVEAVPAQPAAPFLSAAVRSDSYGPYVHLTWNRAAYAVEYSVWVYRNGDWERLGAPRPGETEFYWFPPQAGQTWTFAVLASNGDLHTDSNIVAARI